MKNSVERFSVRGLTGPSGTRYIELRNSSDGCLLRLSDVANSKGGLEQALGRHGIIISPRERTVLMEQMSNLTDYPEITMAEQPGWTKSGCFINAKGELIAADRDARPPLVAFVPADGGYGASGTLEEWRREVADRLAGQTLICFLVMAAFAGAVLALTSRTLNILFEVVGQRGGEGKSTAQALAASVLGCPYDSGKGTYQFKPHGTANWLESCTEMFADSTMILDEIQLFAADQAPTPRTKMLHDLVMRLAERQSKGRFDHRLPFFVRMVVISSANESIRDLMSSRLPHLLGPTVSRLISLPADLGYGAGVFDFVPKGYETSRAFAETLKAAAKSYHGTAIQAFLGKLVKLRADDEGVLLTGIEQRITEFLDAAGVDANDGLSGRVAEAFAIVAVAGRLAKRAGVLPDRWDPQEIALACYRSHAAAAARSEGKPIRAVLRAYAARSDIIILNTGEYPDLSDDAWKASSGLLRSCHGQRELRVPPSMIYKVFPDWTSRKTSPEMKDFLISERGRFDIKRRVRAGRGKERVIVFANFD